MRRERGFLDWLNPTRLKEEYNAVTKGIYAMQLGAPELLIILVIVIILFGVGRIGRIGADLGTAMREFRKGLQQGDDEVKKTDDKSAH